MAIFYWHLHLKTLSQVKTVPLNKHPSFPSSSSSANSSSFLTLPRNSRKNGGPVMKMVPAYDGSGWVIHLLKGSESLLVIHFIELHFLPRQVHGLQRMGFPAHQGATIPLQCRWTMSPMSPRPPCSAPLPIINPINLSTSAALSAKDRRNTRG